MYYGVTHRPEKLEEMMSKDSAAFKLWTNSLVVMALEDARRELILASHGLASRTQLTINRSCS